MYRRIVSVWRVYHAGGPLTKREPALIAQGAGEMIREVRDPTAWNAIQAQASQHSSETGEER